MSELGALLELLHRGGRDVRAISATVRVWNHWERGRPAFMREGEEGSDGAFVSAGIVVVGEDEGEEDPEGVETTRLWIERPDSVREERDDGFYGAGGSSGAPASASELRLNEFRRYCDAERSSGRRRAPNGRWNRSRPRRGPSRPASPPR